MGAEYRAWITAGLQYSGLSEPKLLRELLGIALGFTTSNQRTNPLSASGEPKFGKQTGIAVRTWFIPETFITCRP